MRVLFLTYNGLTEPLGRRQVLPYLIGLASRGVRYTVISFEKAETADVEASRRARELLAPHDVRWTALRYHRTPTVPATAYDALCGVWSGLEYRRGLDLIHARSTVPAAMAWALAGLSGVPWIFDVRGLIAEEYADAGHWDRGGLLFRMTNAAERSLMARADGLVFLSEAVRDALVGRGIPNTKPTAVIPCAADLHVFRPCASARRRLRNSLGLGSAPLLVYAGSLGGWNPVQEMMAFFSVAREEIPGLKFLVVTNQTSAAECEASRTHMAPDVIIRRARPEEVPDHLSAADAGIAFRLGGLSRKAASPTKYGEYLASGLPVVSDAATGDAGRLRGESGWIMVNAFDRGEYRRAARELRDLLLRPDRARAAAVALASRHFDLRMALDRYEALYRRVAGKP